MSYPYSPASSPPDSMSSEHGQKLPSLSKQFPEVFVQRPQSPPTTPALAASPSTRALSPHKRRWSERADPDDFEPERKRPMMRPTPRLPSAPQLAQAPRSPIPIAPSAAPSSERVPFQLPPIRTYLGPYDERPHASPMTSAHGTTRLENFALSQPISRDPVAPARPPLAAERSPYEAERAQERRDSGDVSDVERPLPRAYPMYAPGAPLVTMPPFMSPTYADGLPRPPGYCPPPRDVRDDQSRPYAVTSTPLGGPYSFYGLSPDRPRHSVEQFPGQTHGSPTDASGRYTWEIPPAGVSGSASMPSLANPNGRKRRGNLPKESTQVLNEWFIKHANFPYPKESEKQQLHAATGLTLSQISNWFINARRRRRPETTSTLPPAHAHDPREIQPVTGGPPPPLAQQPYPSHDQWGPR